MNIDEIKKVCDAILSARRVYVIGVRSSLPLAQFLHYYLNHILENVTLASPADGDIFGSLMYADERDLIIGISFPRYSKTTMEGMHFAKMNGAKTIAITDTEDSPLVSFADTTVFVKSNMNSFVDSLVAPMSILNAIIVMVGVSRKEELTKYFDKLEGIWAEKDIYTGKNPGGKTNGE
ncbi:MAG: MurR/RpiR family transcriptional regulator [Eubacteriales bacterium]